MQDHHDICAGAISESEVHRVCKSIDYRVIDALFHLPNHLVEMHRDVNDLNITVASISRTINQCDYGLSQCHEFALLFDPTAFGQMKACVDVSPLIDLYRVIQHKMLLWITDEEDDDLFILPVPLTSHVPVWNYEWIVQMRRIFQTSKISC